MKLLRNISLSLVLALMPASKMLAADTFVHFDKGDIELCKSSSSFAICVSDNDNIGVKLALKNLVNDFASVCDAKGTTSNSIDGAKIVVGTLGSSAVIDQLAKQGKINAKDLKGKVEKYIITTVDGQLVIAGSDRRGTIYGIYELSRQIGVSPWYYWMDVPISKHNTIYVDNGIYTDGEPAVRYRGIFLNDEAPCLTSWVKNTFGTNYGDHRFYEKVFELVLRLKGNYMWPAMWGWAFYADDPLNSKTADDMGIMMGTSHHEPMCRSQKEWHGHTDNPNVEAQDIKSRQIAGNGKWDYSTNKDQLDAFWLGGVERNKNTEDIVTIGMRGDGDMAMSEERNTKLLENIVDNQRKLIAKARGKKASEVPQLWALYKEVLDYYDDGMRVPDDVTMLLCDDNWGNVRRVPTLKERKRKGGWGLYYHVDYVGAPRNTKTLNVTPVENMWEQLSLAYNNGIQKLWILNVGDLKPMEYPIQLFMDLAWNGFENGNLKTDDFDAHLNAFCQTFVGEEKAAEAARILRQYSKLTGRCTPEMLDAKTYNLETGEWAKVVDEFKTLEIEALRQYASLTDAQKPAYYQSVFFPIEVMSNLYQMYYAQAQNNALHEKGDAAMNEWADMCETCFKRDGELMKEYNTQLLAGKWNGMMNQKHIGYTSWNDDFPADIQPTVYRADSVQNIFSEDGKGYVSMEAEHFAESKVESGKGNADSRKWAVIPGMGRTLSGVTLMPVTADVNGASLTYKFEYTPTPNTPHPTPKIHIITKSTLDYLNKGGLTYSVSIDGGEPVIVNFNSDMNEAPENIYDKFYPTIARRVIEKVVELQLASNTQPPTPNIHTLTITPNDPGIIFEKIVIDFGGYKSQYLFGEESLRK